MVRSLADRTFQPSSILAGPDAMGRADKQADLFGIAEAVDYTRASFDEELLYKVCTTYTYDPERQWLRSFPEDGQAWKIHGAPPVQTTLCSVLEKEGFAESALFRLSFDSFPWPDRGPLQPPLWVLNKDVKAMTRDLLAKHAVASLDELHSYFHRYKPYPDFVLYMRDPGMTIMGYGLWLWATCTAKADLVQRRIRAALDPVFAGKKKWEMQFEPVQPFEKFWAQVVVLTEKLAACNAQVATSEWERACRVVAGYATELLDVTVLVPDGAALRTVYEALLEKRPVPDGLRVIWTHNLFHASNLFAEDEHRYVDLRLQVDADLPLLVRFQLHLRDHHAQFQWKRLASELRPPAPEQPPEDLARAVHDALVGAIEGGKVGTAESIERLTQALAALKESLQPEEETRKRLYRACHKVLMQLKREKDHADKELARQAHAAEVEKLRAKARNAAKELDDSMLNEIAKAKFTQIAHLADAVQVFVQGFCKQSNPDAGTVAYGNKLFTMDGLLQYIQELPDQAWVIATWSDRAPTQEQAKEELEAVKAGMHGYQHPTAKGKKASDAQLEKLKPKGLQQMLDVVTRLTTLATVMNEKPA